MMQKIVLILLSLSSAIQFAHGQNQMYKISNIEAHLFYNRNNDFSDEKVAGTISENILENPEFYLWNTIIGEGSAEGASSQTLIIINIEGEKSTYEIRTLKIVCKIEDNIISSQENDFSNFSQHNKYSYCVLLNDTGCGKVEIVAEIINKKSNETEDKMVKTLDFWCGE